MIWPKAATCGHLRPLAAARGLAATCLEFSRAATCGHLRSLAATCLELSGAATCGHSSGWKWLQVAAMHLLQRPLAAACSSGHLQPIEWLQVAESGCKWLQVAASGCMLVEIHGRVGILKKQNGFAGKAFFSSLEVR